MKIGISLTSSLSVGQEYIDLTRTICELFAKEGFGIVYGGTEYGMMKELAESYKQAGGKDLTGVMSHQLAGVTKGYKAFDNLDQALWVDTIGERISTISHNADGLLILPGGYGTLEELGSMIGGKANKIYDKPIVILNYNGFYDHLIEFLDNMSEKNFSKINIRDIVHVADSMDGVLDYFKNYSTTVIPDKFV